MSEEFRAELQAVINRLEPEFRSLGAKDIEIIVRSGVNSYEALLRLMHSETAEVETRSAACWLLARLGRDERGESALSKLLSAEIPQLRSSAARSLAEMGAGADLWQVIAVLLQDADSDVRASAAYALGLLGECQAVPSLLTKLSDQREEPKVRGLAAEALADLNDDRAVVPLINALRDESPEVRYWAAFALGELGDPQALPELQRLIAADNVMEPYYGTVRHEAEAAIERLMRRRSKDE
jgi:HEAT repeat protein